MEFKALMHGKHALYPQVPPFPGPVSRNLEAHFKASTWTNSGCSLPGNGSTSLSIFFLLMIASAAGH